MLLISNIGINDCSVVVLLTPRDKLIRHHIGGHNGRSDQQIRLCCFCVPRETTSEWAGGDINNGI